MRERAGTTETETASKTVQEIDQKKLEGLLGRVVNDFGATISSALAVVGDKLGLYRALAKNGPLDSQELALQTGTHERYVRDWLVNQAAGGYVEYDPATGKYRMSREQAMILADEDSPFFVAGGFELFTSAIRAQERVTQNLKSGKGMFWTEHHPGLFHGTERFFRPGYTQNLVSGWIPALSGVQDKLRAGAKVADVGCGHGASTIIMGKAYPKSRFFGFDFHGDSIARAREAASEAGVADRITFEVAGSTEFPGSAYDLVAFFDCLHDLPKPVETIRRVREALAPEGTVLIVEPMATETVEGNLNPVGRIFSAASVFICMPNAVAGGGEPLGTIATEEALRTVVIRGGLSRFRRVAETPFNRIFEAKM